MVKAYLEKNRQELLKLQIDLLNKIQHIDMGLKEKKKMLQYIENSGDKSYESFSPQNLTMELNQKKINQIKQEIEQDQQEIKQLNKKQIEIKSKIYEVDAVIISYRKDKHHFNLDNNIQNTETKISSYNLSSLKNRVELCYKLVDLDISRCKIELKNILEILDSL